MPVPHFVDIPEAQPYWLKNARLPLALLDDAVSHRAVIPALSAAPFSEEWVAADVQIAAGEVSAIAPVGTATPTDQPTVDLRKGVVWPGFVDLHTHLDKGQTWNRAPNRDGSFDRALEALFQDAAAWSADDLYRRMDFGLRCSYAHGTVALRTHFDAFGEMAKTALDVLKTLRQEWAGRLEIQAVSLVSLDYFLQPEGAQLADWVAEYGAILGGVAYPSPDLRQQLDRVFQLARDRQLDLDFHVDESLRDRDRVLPQIAQAKLRHDFIGAVICGHCCSLSVQSAEVVEDTLRWVREAGIGIVSLPMCNLYLQDRHPGITPRYRGVTLLHELKQRGVPVAVSSDNCRDAFYAYGDHDGLEVFTQAVRIGHLDRPIADWARAVTWTPATLMGLPHMGRLGVGRAADLVLFKARTYNELLARPQSDRVVLRQGQAINTIPPDYAELDDLLGLA